MRATRDAFERRSASLEQVLIALRERGVVRDAVTGSLLHMHVNRMLGSYDPLSEQALFDALWRVRRSRIARRGNDGR